MFSDVRIYGISFSCPRGEMDITTVFGTVVVGSNPAEGTSRRTDLLGNFKVLVYNGSQCGYGLVVECVLAKDETRVRFSLPAQNQNRSASCWSILIFGRSIRESHQGMDREPDVYQRRGVSRSLAHQRHLFKRTSRLGGSPIKEKACKISLKSLETVDKSGDMCIKDKFLKVKISCLLQ